MTIALLAVALPARAQTKNESAREAAEQGRRAYNLGNWQESIDGFERAYKLSGDPALLFNLGQAHRQLGQGGEAIRFYKAYLRNEPVTPNREVAEKQIKELEAQSWRGPPDGQTAPAIPKPAPKTPVLEPVGPTPEAPKTVVTEPAPSPPALLSQSSAPSAPPRAPLPRWLPITGAAVAVGLMTGAIVYGLSGSSQFDSLRGSCGQTTAGCTSAQIDDVKSRDRTATVLWVLAGVVAAGTGVSVYVNTRAAGVAALWRF